MRRFVSLGALCILVASCKNETPFPADVSISPVSWTFNSLNDSKAFLATVKDNFGILMSDPNVVWRSSNNSVASVAGDGVSADVTSHGTGTTTITATVGDVSGQATVTVELSTLTVSAAGNGAGSVGSNPPGISCDANAGFTSGDCSETYSSGLSVSLTANPSAGSSFGGWGGSCSGLGGCNVVMSQLRSVTATFTLTPQQLTVSTSGTGQGSVSSNLGGIACSRSGGATTGDCTELYAFGSSVTLTATPLAGGTFTGWSGEGCSGTNTCTVTMNQARNVSAAFTAPPQLLTVSTAGTGSGSVSSNPSGISCTRSSGTTTGDCTELYALNTSVILTAAPVLTSTFTGWTGEGCGGTGTCTVLMSQARNVTATFTVATPLLTVLMEGTGNGTVTSNPAGVNCVGTAGVESGDCTETYVLNTLVILTATAAGGHIFAGWSGEGCTGTGTCTVTMAIARTVTATFTAPAQLLSVTPAGAGSGSVSSNPAGITCTRTAGVTSGDCTELYALNTSVTLTATAPANNTFAGWSGEGCAGTGTCTVIMSQARTVTPTFTTTGQLLTVSTSGSGNGSVSANPAGITCTRLNGATTGDCAEVYTTNTQVTLTATAAAGHTFSGWSGEGCGGLGTCIVTMSQARNVTAAFDAPARALVVTPQGTGNGTVTSDVGGLNCSNEVSGTSGTCLILVANGTIVTLTAVAPSGSVFTGWSGPCTGTGPCVVAMTQNQNVFATFTATAFGSISGQAMNAFTGVGVNAAPLELRVGANATTGPAFLTTRADAGGLYTFGALPNGTYTVRAALATYHPATHPNIDVVGGAATTGQVVPMVPVIPASATVIVLTWDAVVFEMDGHLTGPLSGVMTRFRVAWDNMGSLVASPFAQLYQDRFFPGPEVFHISSQIAGVYRFSVHDWSNSAFNPSTTLASSKARVKVYKSTGLVTEFTVPNTGGTLWTVFEMNGAVITPVNAMSYQPDHTLITQAPIPQGPTRWALNQSTGAASRMPTGEPAQRAYHWLPVVSTSSGRTKSRQR